MALPVQTKQKRTARSEPAAGLHERATVRTYVVSLVVLAVILEATVFVVVRRLSLYRYPSIVPTAQPVADALGVTEQGLTWFVVAFGVLVLGHVLAYAVALRISNPRAGLIAFAASVVLIATMLPIFPGGAHDVYHNIVDARTLWVYHQNPISTPPDAHPQDPLVQQLVYWQDLPSSYGPVWYILSGIPTPFAGDDLVANVVGQKLLVSVFLLGTLAIVYDLVRRWRPAAATAAVVLFGWSPLVLWEIPGNAHNDVVMMFFAVAALYCAQRGRWQWSFPLLALAVAVKFIMLLLGPLMLVWLLYRRPRVDRREIALSIGAGALVLALIYVPFLAASHSLANYHALENRFISSPASLAVALMLQYTSLSHAELYARVIATCIFVVLYVWTVTRSRGSFDKLTHAAFCATLVMLVLPTWWFWPWYVVWLLPLAALAAGRGAATIGLLFGSSALMVYPIYYWRDVLLNGPNWYANQFVIVGAVFGPLLIYLLATWGRGYLTLASPEPVEKLAAP